MADLIIKPATGDGNKLILQDKAGGAVLTTADSGATIASATLTSPTINTPTIATPTITGAATFSGDLVPSTPLSHRNMIINGAMQVSQRTTSETSVNSDRYSACDRFKIFNNAIHFTVSQAVDAPDGFRKSLKCDVTTHNASMAVSDYVYIAYKIEGQDVQHLAKGTSSAKAVTLSFWAKTYQAGTYQVNLRDITNNRMISATYTCTSATWEKHTVTFAGDTTGAIGDANTEGMRLEWWLGGGNHYTSGTAPSAWETQASTDKGGSATVNVGDSTNNYFQITGIQLELGSNATPFEHRSYGEELARCQRYYQKSSNTTRMWPIMEDSGASGYRRGIVWFMQQMRDTPAISGLTFYGGGSTGIQNEGPTSFTPFSNGIAAAAESGLTAWTADKEL